MVNKEDIGLCTADFEELRRILLDASIITMDDVFIEDCLDKLEQYLKDL